MGFLRISFPSLGASCSGISWVVVSCGFPGIRCCLGFAPGAPPVPPTESAGGALCGVSVSGAGLSFTGGAVGMERAVCVEPAGEPCVEPFSFVFFSTWGPPGTSSTMIVTSSTVTVRFPSGLMGMETGLCVGEITDIGVCRCPGPFEVWFIFSVGGASPQVCAHWCVFGGECGRCCLLYFFEFGLACDPFFG